MELDHDDGLGFAVGKAGRDVFLFGGDFPHELFDAKTATVRNRP